LIIRLNLYLLFILELKINYLRSLIQKHFFKDNMKLYLLIEPILDNISHKLHVMIIYCNHIFFYHMQSRYLLKHIINLLIYH